MKQIKSSVDIHASREMVWQVLTKDEYTREWYASFSEGAKAEQTGRKEAKLCSQIIPAVA